jgi:major type 1 subunit fimbrin (pilin)
MFKKTVIATALLSSFVFNAAYADDSGVINFTGQIIDTTCDINGGPVGDIDVVMGVGVSSDLNAGAGTAGPEIPFEISLDNCNAAISTATVNISGLADSNDSSLLALTAGGATGVGIGLSAGSTPYVLGKDIPVTITNNTGKVSLTAKYVSTGNSVGVGVANATADYSISYN